MKHTAFDTDKILSDFLTDYLDDNLNRAEQRSFQEYLAQNEEEREFARKALKGKRALARLASKFNNTSSVTA